MPASSYEGLKIAVGRELPHHVEIKCPIEMHGTAYGGWYIMPSGLTRASIIYSFGIGEDLSFDLSLIEQYGVTLHAFDPTPESLAWVIKQELPSSLVIHEFGISAKNGFADLYAPAQPGMISHSFRSPKHGLSKISSVKVPVKRIGTIMHELGHDHVDILKMDIEGAEYEVLEDIIRERIQVKQVLVEFHHFLPGIKVAQTRAILEKLRMRGYRIFYVDPLKHEFSLIRDYHPPASPSTRR
jgi:FkbM family methyltransferase